MGKFEAVKRKGKTMRGVLKIERGNRRKKGMGLDWTVGEKVGKKLKQKTKGWKEGKKEKVRRLNLCTKF